MAHVTKSKSRENGTLVVLTISESARAIPYLGQFQFYKFGAFFQ